MKKNLFFYAACIHNPDSMSGGDRILIELAKVWQKYNNITLITSKEGQELAKKYGVTKVKYIIIGKPYKNETMFSLFSKRLFSGISFAFKTKLPENSVIYSTSNFITDSFPSFLLKKFNKSSWIGGYYLEPPNPFYGYDESKAKLKFPKLGDFSFYIQDRLSKFLIRHFADMIYVTSEPDAKKFPVHNKEDKVVIVKGGIDLETSNKIKNKKFPYFDAVFMGRFHPQKGVLELIDIWKQVCKTKPNAKLAVIGYGKLENQIKEKIKKTNQEKNIALFGFTDGIEKVKIFKNSKMVLHPAKYDSGGMASCEAMACRLPGVSYDLEALKTYYPKGMLKTKIGDQKQFAENILKLLDDKKLYNKTRADAYNLAKEWDWNKRAEEVYSQTFKK